MARAGRLTSFAWPPRSPSSPECFLPPSSWRTQMLHNHPTEGAPIATPETWRKIPSAPDYDASSHGRIRRRWKRGRFSGRPLTPEISNAGYARVGVVVDGRLRKISVHRAVCEAFHGPPPTGDHECAHGDGNRLHNRPGNLRWATRAENMADCAVYGRARIEENASHSNLTKDAVAEIRAATRSYGFVTRLAKKFGVSKSCIEAVRQPQRGLWPSVPFPGDAQCH